VPWYAWLYAGYLIFLTISSVHTAVPDEDPMLLTIVDLLAGACEIGFVIAWYREVSFAQPWMVAAGLLFVAAWFIAECIRVALKRRASVASGDPDAIPLRMLVIALAFSALRITPAMIAGIGVLRRSGH
jgi:hypothetical protein